MMDRKRIVETLKKYFTNDTRIHSLYLTGSYKKNMTSFSDIDIWIVCQEEKDVAFLIKTLPDELDKVFKIVTYYSPIYYHFFFVIYPMIQLDINIVSAAQYFSIKSLDNVLVNNFSSSMKSHNPKNIIRIEQRLIYVYTTLHRCMSKYLKKDYLVAARFIEGIRNDCIRGLVSLIQTEIDISNQVDINLSKVDRDLAILIKDMYPRPEKLSINKGIKAVLKLLDLIEKKYTIRKYKVWKIKLERNLHNTTIKGD